MKYSLKTPAEIERAKQYLDTLIEKKAIVEIKKVSPKRSLNQNNYLHLLLGAFGEHFGYTLEESKLIYKELNAQIYAYSKKNRTFWKSSAELTVEEMTKSIDVLREWSKRGGYPLPTATDKDWLMQLENAIEQSKHYL